MCESYSERETKQSSEVDGEGGLGARGGGGENKDNNHILISVLFHLSLRHSHF